MHASPNPPYADANRLRKREQVHSALTPRNSYLADMHRRNPPPLPRSPPLAAPALAQAIDVSAVNAYLVGLRGAQGRFRQTNPNGSTQTGTFYLAKPGRIRFEYDVPEGAMVIADGTNVGVFDPKSNRNPTRYPLSRTPLSLLLRENLSLREPGMVLGATRDAAGVNITVVDPRSPNEGRMVMTLRRRPDRAETMGDHHQDRPAHRSGGDRPDDGGLDQPQPFQHRAGGREPALTTRRPRPSRKFQRPHIGQNQGLSLVSRVKRANSRRSRGHPRPPGRPILRRVEVDHRRPPRGGDVGDELRRLAQHLARAPVAGQRA